MRNIFTFFFLIFLTLSSLAVDTPPASLEVSLDSTVNVTCKEGNNGAIFISLGSTNAYVVEGAGTEEANGYYIPVSPDDTGDASGGSIYSNGTFFIYYHPGPGTWVIDDNLIASSPDEFYYWDENFSGNLAEAVWSNFYEEINGPVVKTKESRVILKNSRIAPQWPITKNIGELPPASLGEGPVPTGYILTTDEFVVTGAGTGNANGLYKVLNLSDKGDGEGHPVYSNGAFYIYFHPGPDAWVIDNNLYANGWTELFYFDENRGEDLKDANWINFYSGGIDAKAAPDSKALGSNLKYSKTAPDKSFGSFNLDLGIPLLGASPAPISMFYFYEYNWTGPDGFTSNHQDLTDLGRGEYSLVITPEMSMDFVKADAGIKYLKPIESEPLAVFGPISITEPENSMEITLEGIQNASCPGSLNGTIDISVEGGTQPYLYEWRSANGNGENFSGYYEPENWNVDIGDGDGDVSISTNSLEIEGNNNYTNGVYTQATIVVVESGDFSFDWDYSSYDSDGPSYDPAYYINKVRFQLTDNEGSPDQSGHISFEAEAGDTIGFAVYSTDGGAGEGYLTISNFTYPTSGVISTKQDLEAGSGSYLVEITDANGCTVISDEYEISDLDTEKPVAICKDATVYLDEEGKASITSAAINNGSYDNCSLHLPLVDKKYFDCSDLGENTVTLTVNDFSGNYDFCAATVTIADSIKPVIAAMDDITVVASADECAAVVEFEAPVATDVCGVEVEQTEGPASGSEFPVGTTVVTFVATDIAGNTASSSFTVTVEGINKAPVIDPVDDVTAELYETSIEVPLTGLSYGEDCLEQSIDAILVEASNTEIVTGSTVTYIPGEDNAIINLTLAGGISGTSNITVSVKDNAGVANDGIDSTQTSFVLTVAQNQAPQVAVTADTIYVDKGATSVETLPTDLFSDPDAGDELTFEFTGENGAAIPDWISLNAETMEVTLSPTENELGEHKFVITATDKMGETASLNVVVVVEIPTGIDDLANTFGLNLYPNPTKGTVFITIDKEPAIHQAEVSVHNLIGQSVLNKVYDLSGPITLDLSNQTNGFYFVKIKIGANEVTRKIILKKE